MSVTLELPPEIDARIEGLVVRTGYDRATLLRMLVETGIEDLEDAATADEVWERVQSGEERTYTAAEVRAELGLDD